MELTSENIIDWKLKLNIKMLLQIGVTNFSETLTNKEWLEMYIGDTVQDVIDNEVDAMRSCI